jgi:hypothetical protein
MRRVTPGAVEGVSTRATLGWIPRSPCKKVVPREITHQEKRAGEGGCGEGKLGAACREGERTSACIAHRWRSSTVPRPGALSWVVAAGVGPPCRRSGRSRPPSRHCSMVASLPSGRAHTLAHPHDSELYCLTTPSPPRCLPPPDRRGRGLSNSAAAMGSEEAPVELHGVRVVSSSMSLLPWIS